MVVVKHCEYNANMDKEQEPHDHVVMVALQDCGNTFRDLHLLSMVEGDHLDDDDDE